MARLTTPVRARTSFLVACMIAAGVLGCDVPAYELGYDETGVEGDAFDDGDAAFVDTASTDTAPRPDTTTVDTAEVGDVADTSEVTDGADATDATDATDTAPEADGPADTACGAGPACAAGETCCAGTCVDLASSLANCGACGKPCAVTGGVAKCEAAVCKVASCDAGRGDCDGRVDNGCEATLDNTTNCGACGSKCEMPNGIGTCGTGTCVIAGCFSGFDDCDKVVANGCEVDLTKDPLHCGSCAKACPTAGGTPVCVARVCK